MLKGRDFPGSRVFIFVGFINQFLQPGSPVEVSRGWLPALQARAGSFLISTFAKDFAKDKGVSKLAGFKQLNGEIVSNYTDLIMKDLVVGFLVIAYQSSNNNQVVTLQPLQVDWEGLSDGIPLDKNEKIVGIIPAPLGSYAVYGLMPDNTYALLGYEFPAAYHPDWFGELIRQRESKKELTTYPEGRDS